MARYLLDTNILLRSSDPNSPSYSLAVNTVARLISQGHECVITAQVLIEFWVVATRPVNVNGLGWSVERTENEINQLLSQFLLIEETPLIFPNWLQLVTSYRVMGKRTHDTRLMAVMKTHGITQILTFNPDDFIKTPEIIIVHPNQVI
ncbi:type II toxin-antitoxin system VapC family toxin [Plectonema radiosum NIES-515]|uniref:Type II toxin-antitoxin system VapC family toxin n=1 Tax=Plectonema radiosum NIES-515 TaxID=2986073 RepID=A0ABT3B3J3_9CYAN|nr:type II toxin-antitoxin system VapC family toxin [Plectonema radiosum]MCV3215439.1 type II toxin-antitoxin system VapC family toxin [Plectonema radiosum NIES-515]